MKESTEKCISDNLVQQPMRNKAHMNLIRQSDSEVNELLNDIMPIKLTFF